MAGNVYAANFTPTAVAVAADIWEVTAPADAVVVIHGFYVFQTSDVGDVAEEILGLYAQRQLSAGTSGSVGATVVTAPLNKGMAATGATVEGLNTTIASGSLTVTERFGWNVRVPLLFWYTPETRPTVSPSDRWLLSLPAPADSLTLGATVWFEEIGG